MFQPIKLLLAYYAYALDRPAECLSILEEVPNLHDSQSRVSAYDTMRADSTVQSISASSTADSSASTSIAGSLSSTSRTEVEDDRLWGITEAIRSIALKGT